MGAELEADGKALVRSSVLRQHGHYLGELFVHDVADAFEGLQCVVTFSCRRRPSPLAVSMK